MGISNPDRLPPFFPPFFLGPLLSFLYACLLAKKQERSIHCQIERVRSYKMLATEQICRSLTICSFYSRKHGRQLAYARS
ncbi:hypothetical protein DM01DRAFT_1120736 [Hesseltinella vesiculosa]|uniref:Uncharacterized protein n=1 Tax=Hesseltinella vesiculosa TaxID=101127 RepID=A0A1X2GTJ4_9FUNG|nr:hypothetical protein DM01DRAFT_1120736 [Hesseltinella vesiculosa]